MKPFQRGLESFQPKRSPNNFSVWVPPFVHVRRRCALLLRWRRCGQDEMQPAPSRSVRVRRKRPFAADAAGQLRRMPSAYFIIGPIVSAMAADAASGVIAPLPTAVMSSSTAWLILTPFWPGQANQGSARPICRALVAKLGLAS